MLIYKFEYHQHNILHELHIINCVNAKYFADDTNLLTAGTMIDASLIKAITN
jgi:hypothetical protein